MYQPSSKPEVSDTQLWSAQHSLSTSAIGYLLFFIYLQTKHYNRVSKWCPIAGCKAKSQKKLSNHLSNHHNDITPAERLVSGALLQGASQNHKRNWATIYPTAITTSHQQWERKYCPLPRQTRGGADRYPRGREQLKSVSIPLIPLTLHLPPPTYP